MKTIDDMDMKDKRVLMRASYDVPIENGQITDDSRIKSSIPSIQRIFEKGARQLIIISHMGRPKGKVVEELRLNPVAQRLSELLGQEVIKLDDCIDMQIPDARIVMLENLRFHAEEEENYEFFAKKLASYADIYVNECFAVSHRKHASLVAVTQFLPSCAGLHLANEYEMLTTRLREPNRPYVAIMGGAKVSDKLNVIDALLRKVDRLLLGGAMIFTFYKAKGLEVGTSLCEPDKVKLASLIMNNEKLVLPSDIVVAKDRESQPGVVAADHIPPDMKGLDIGPASVDIFKGILKDAKTVVWNGPMGLFEDEKFATGTNEIAGFLASLDATVIVGGGDSAAALKKAGLTDKITHVSTGGGASLRLLEGKQLPAIAALG